MTRLERTADGLGERVDQFLARTVSNLTRSGAQRLLEEGAVLCGGEKVKKNRKTPKRKKALPPNRTAYGCGFPAPGLKAQTSALVPEWNTKALVCCREKCGCSMSMNRGNGAA